MSKDIPIKVGYWYTMCCELDLRQLTAEDDLEDIRRDVEQYGARVWPTKESALAEIAAGYHYEVSCARCGKIGSTAQFIIEEGDEWECPACNRRENHRERLAITEASDGKEIAQAVEEILLAIKPLLAGKPSFIQGAALGELLSLFLVGHPNHMREPLLEAHLHYVRSLIPESEREVFGEKGHPGNSAANKPQAGV